MKRTYYDILGVPPEATPTEIKAAHRLLVKQLHPDVERGACRERLLEVMRAYQVLMHPAHRRAYDAQLARKGYTAAHALRSLSARVRQWLGQWADRGETAPPPTATRPTAPPPAPPETDASFDRAMRQASGSNTSPYNRDRDGVIRRSTPDRELPEIGSLRRNRTGGPRKTPLSKSHPWDLWRR